MNRYSTIGTAKQIKIPPEEIYTQEIQDRTNLRTAAYCRVSTDNKEQETSFEIQVAHYESYISAQKNWVFAGIYADEGISATSTKRRAGFRRMIADAKAGRFDMIITKSVSRFARNLVDGIQTARDLLHLAVPVAIYFEEENLNTFRSDSEFILTIMFMIAQGESEKKSAAVKKAFAWRCDADNYLTPTNALLGYEKDAEGMMVIEREGAKTVRAIYAMYLNGYSLTRIARILTASNKPTGLGNPVWGAGSVMGILCNERMAGMVVAQKTVTVNMLEHKIAKNKGKSMLYYRDDHHEGIVTQDEHIRALLLMDCNNKSAYFNPNYQIRVVKTGLLEGFIPINITFGGYSASHYLGATTRQYTPKPKSASSVRVIRSQEIKSGNAPQLLISTKSLAFNSNCKSRLTTHVEILLHPHERLLAVRPTDPDNPDAVPCKALSAAAFAPVLFELMGWHPLWRYRVTADYLYGVLIFDLNDPEYLINDNRTLQAKQWRNAIGVEAETWMAANRRAAALRMTKLDIDAPAEPIENYPGNPGRMSKTELNTYLNSLGVNAYET